VGVRARAPLKSAVVTGAHGQDGSYLTELLLEHGYDVRGVDRGDVDLTDVSSVSSLLDETRADELYHLAAPSFVPQSWEDPVAHARTAVLGVTAVLEAARLRGGVRVFYASSAEIFGNPEEAPQRETTPLRPISPYGAAKAYGTSLVDAYRRRYGLHASCGILYNHESPRRPTSFLPSKVAHGVADIVNGSATELVLGDLDAARDWGYAPDYVRAMWQMLQHDDPNDYVIATGEQHTVRELVEIAFARANLDWREHVRVDDSLKRGAVELHGLVGDPARARAVLGWTPTVTFSELVHVLVDAALGAA
jgi:GDPmannose 4,6-dehydratase